MSLNRCLVYFPAPVPGMVDLFMQTGPHTGEHQQHADARYRGGDSDEDSDEDDDLDYLLDDPGVCQPFACFVMF